MEAIIQEINGLIYCVTFITKIKSNRNRIGFIKKFYFHLKKSAFKHHDAPAHDSSLETLMLAH
jgi:hypothetical protein